MEWPSQYPAQSGQIYFRLNETHCPVYCRSFSITHTAQCPSCGEIQVTRQRGFEYTRGTNTSQPLFPNSFPTSPPNVQWTPYNPSVANGQLPPQSPSPIFSDNPYCDPNPRTSGGPPNALVANFDRFPPQSSYGQNEVAHEPWGRSDGQPVTRNHGCLGQVWGTQANRQRRDQMASPWSGPSDSPPSHPAAVSE